MPLFSILHREVERLKKSLCHKKGYFCDKVILLLAASSKQKSQRIILSFYMLKKTTKDFYSSVKSPSAKPTANP